jgi:hypothetical protein
LSIAGLERNNYAFDREYDMEAVVVRKIKEDYQLWLRQKRAAEEGDE